MIWNDHSKLEGCHAFLGASQFHWINWTNETLEQRFYSRYSTETGTAIHELAKDCIKSRMKLTKHDKHLIELALYRAYIPKGAYDSEVILTNLIPYVNDAIGFHMSPEVILYYSDYCFGTTDTIYFNEKEKILRIHDLKTGSVPAHIEQLMVYAALFCLEYHRDPHNFNIELRLYQNCETIINNPNPDDIQKIMDLIVKDNTIINNVRERDA